jgi:hypothetical protein
MDESAEKDARRVKARNGEGERGPVLENELRVTGAEVDVAGEDEDAVLQENVL